MPPMGGGYSPNVPGLRTMYRVLETQIVRRFKGMNVYSNITMIGPDTALACQNVICSNSGALSKLRYPVNVTAAHGGLITGPDRMYDFQQAIGTRQILATDAAGSVFYYDVNAAYAYHLIENAPLDSGLWDIVTANNIAFAANGQRMMKWTGTKWQNWGIQTPTTAPTGGLPLAIASISLTGNVVTVTLQSSATNLGIWAPKVGSLVLISGIPVPNDILNGTFPVTASTIADPCSFQYALTNPNIAAILNTGTVVVQVINATAAVDHVESISGVVNIYSTASFIPWSHVAVGQQFMLAGLAHTIFNGGPFIISAIDLVNNKISFLMASSPDLAKTADAGTFSQANADTTVFSWGVAYGNSVTGHIGSMSPISVASEFQFLANGFQIVNAPAPLVADGQIDTIYWYRTLEGGSIWYLATTTTYNPLLVNPFSIGTTILSTLSDAEINTAITAQQQFNNPPLVGANLSVFQGRVFISGLSTAPQDIIYSGYEYILTGRPEESFPPFNRLRLAIGADMIKGHGVIQAGVVAFSRSNQMYMFRGIVEDVTTTAPLLFSAYLEELPWKYGCYSHQSIASTPYGLVWFAADKTVQVYDGTSQPICISGAVAPYLRDIKAGTEGNVRGKYIKWLDRDWYVLSFNWSKSAINTNVNNTILVFDLNPAQEQNSGAFLFSIEADDLAVIEDPATGRRRLCISNNGLVKELPIQDDNINGIQSGTIPATANLLPAFWQGGYYGQDNPQTRKMARWGRLKTDNPNVGIIASLVDDESYDFRNPLIVAARIIYNKFSINRKTKRVSLTVTFPQADVSANVQEVQFNMIPTGDN